MMQPALDEGCVFGLFADGDQDTVSISHKVFRTGKDDEGPYFKDDSSCSDVSSEDGVGPSIEEADSLIANEISKMTFQEREKAENDIHAIGGDREAETPELLGDCIAQLDPFLKERKLGTALELAEAMDRSYTSAYDFRAMFVRAERYDAKEAANRMIQFFEVKRDLFGAEKLVRDITLSDLSPDDMEALESGGMQVCPSTDSAGRSIIATMLGLRKYKAVENMQRACFYIYMAVAKGIEAQRLGIVNISYCVGCRDFQSVQGPLRTSIPLHIACQHFAYDDLHAYGKITMAIFMLSKLHRVRMRSHMGTHIECQYALNTFGIPRGTLPVDEWGIFSTEKHLAWLQKIREFETNQFVQTTTTRFVMPVPCVALSQALPRSIAEKCTMRMPKKRRPGSKTAHMPSHVPLSKRIDPYRSDILFGRGKTVVKHPGNAWFRDMVENTMLQYESCTRMEKASLAEAIVEMVKESGGRFLKPSDDKDFWEEVDDHTARRKVAHTFRNRRQLHSMKPIHPVTFSSSSSSA